MRQSNLGDYETVESNSDYDDERDTPDGYKDEQTLRNMYHRDEMTQSEIADSFDKATSTINRYMDNYGIESRSLSETSRRKWDRERAHVKLTEEKLQELYIGENMSIKRIADDLDCSWRKVSARLDEHDIERHSHSHVVKSALGKNPASFYVNTQGYEVSDNRFQDERFVCLIHRLCAVAWFGFDAVRENIVHHKNGFKRDNREANLEVMGNAEHTAHHNEVDNIGFPHGD